MDIWSLLAWIFTIIIVYSLVLALIEKIHVCTCTCISNTNKVIIIIETVFHPISKHLKFCQKKTLLCVVLNPVGIKWQAVATMLVSLTKEVNKNYFVRGHQYGGYALYNKVSRDSKNIIRYSGEFVIKGFVISGFDCIGIVCYLTFCNHRL